MELYNRLYKALLDCEEFESNMHLQATIANSELAIYSRQFCDYECETKEERIKRTIKYLTRQRLRNIEPALSIFLKMVYSNLIEGDALRDELEELSQQVKLELVKPLHPHNLSSFSTTPENVSHNSNGNYSNTSYSDKTSNYPITQQGNHSIEKKLQEVRGQYRAVQTLPKYKIDAGSLIEYNLDQQKNKFIEGLDGHYTGVFVFTVANIDRTILEDYVLGSLIWKLKQHIRRPTDPVRHVYLSLEYLDFSSTEQGVHSLQREFERQLFVHPLTDLLADHQRTNLVIVVWYRDITRDHFQPIVLEFVRRFKAQVTDILRRQERCLILFWANYGPSVQPLDVPTVLPTFEQFEVQHLSEWLEYELGTQLRDQNVSEQEIKYCREKLVAKVKYHGGRLPETYAILRYSLELGGVL